MKEVGIRIISKGVKYSLNTEYLVLKRWPSGAEAHYKHKTCGIFQYEGLILVTKDGIRSWCQF